MNGYQIYLDRDGFIIFSIDTGAGNGVTSITNITLGKWYHVAGVYNGSDIALYVNGEFQGSGPISGSIASTMDLYIGRNNPAEAGFPNWNTFFNGTIDDVRLYNRPLSEGQINSHYQGQSEVMVSPETMQGETWFYTIVPNDGITDGEKVVSNNLTVLVDVPLPTTTTTTTTSTTTTTIIESAPDIWVSPMDISDTLYSGNVSSRNLTIGNNGTAQLNYNITGIFKEAIGANNNISVLLATSDSSNLLKTDLQAYPDIALVDQFSTQSGVPTLEQLLSYDVVVVWSNYGFNNATALGNLLADYVDQGGRVVLQTFSWFAPSYDLRGRLIEEGYSPFNQSGPNLYSLSNLGWYQADHPIMSGIASASDYYRDNVSLTSGADQIANWSDGMYLAAVKGRVVGINSYPGDSRNQSGNLSLMTHNAISYLAGWGWFALSSTNGSLEANSQVDLNLTINSTNLGGGQYRSNITIESNDPDENPLLIPLELTVLTTTTTTTTTTTSTTTTTILDDTPPSINFVAPTPAEGSILQGASVYVNVTSNEPLSTALLEWNGVNESMQKGSWHQNKTGLEDGIYTYRVWGNDTSGNWNTTPTRTVILDNLQPIINIIYPSVESSITIFNDLLYGYANGTGSQIKKVNISLNEGPSVEVLVDPVACRFQKRFVYTPDQWNHVMVSGVDGAGNYGESFTSFFVNIPEKSVSKNTTANESTIINETLENTDTAFEIRTKDNQSITFNVTSFSNESEKGFASLNSSNVLGVFGENETSIGKFIEIETSENINGSSGNLSFAVMKIYLRSEDLDLDGDGLVNGTGDLNISTVKIYWYNETGGTWHPLVKGADYEPLGPYVFDAGVNDTTPQPDSYIGHVYANVSHFSVYGASASVYGGGSVVVGGGAGVSSGGGDKVPSIIDLQRRGSTNIIRLVSNDINFLGLVRQFNYFYKRFFDGPENLWGSIGASGAFQTPMEWAKVLDPVTHPHDVEILTGDGYKMASELAMNSYPDGVDRIILARGDLGEDSLAASTYANILGIPILLTEPASLPESTRNTLSRYGNPSVLIVGGKEAISEAIENSISLEERIGGGDRYETAGLIAEKLLSESPSKVLVITDGLKPDGTTLMVAQYYDAPIMFVNGDEVPDPTAMFLKAHSFESIILIGVSEDAERQIRSSVNL